MTSLKKYLLLNASFSGISGVSLVLFSSKFMSLFGLNDALIFIVLGVGLLGFSGFVFWVTLKKESNKKLVQLITIMDLLWVIASLIIFWLKAFDLTNIGYTIITLVALWIAFLAFQQNRFSKA